jgi:hypothetical protein
MYVPPVHSVSRSANRSRSSWLVHDRDHRHTVSRLCAATRFRRQLIVSPMLRTTFVFAILVNSIAPLVLCFAPTNLRCQRSLRVRPFSKMCSSKVDLDESELKAILSTATIAAKKAGEIIISNSSGADVTKTKANPRDLLTLIDPLCEKIIKSTVLADFPSHDFLGEEDVPPGKEASAAALDAKLKTEKDFLWIVDPVRN